MLALHFSRLRQSDFHGQSQVYSEGIGIIYDQDDRNMD